MKYGIVQRSDWHGQHESFPDDTFCVVFLDNTGKLAFDELIENISGVPTASGRVWQLPTETDPRPYFMGIISLPMDIAYIGQFNLEWEAIDYYLRSYVNDDVEIERQVNAEADSNRNIDTYIWNSQIDRNRRDFYLYLAVFIVLFLIILGVLYIIRHTGVNHAIPLIPSYLHLPYQLQWTHTA
jgi:hypothetical protein